MPGGEDRSHTPRSWATSAQRGTFGLGIHVVLSGAIEIVRPGILVDELIRVQRAGEFTGEVNVLAGRRALVRARMVEEGDVLVIGAQGLRRLIQEDPEVSELRALTE